MNKLKELQLYFAILFQLLLFHSDGLKKLFLCTLKLVIYFYIELNLPVRMVPDLTLITEWSCGIYVCTRENGVRL